MANTVWQAARGGGTVGPGATNYRVLADAFTQPATQATEANAQITMRLAGTFAGLYTHVSTNTITATSTLRFRKNAANGNGVVSIGASTTGDFSDTTHTDAVVATDKIAAQLVTGATGTALLDQMVGVQFSATTNTVQKLGSVNSGGAITAAGTHYFSWGGDNAPNTTEANVQLTMKGAATLQNLYIFVSSAINKATTITSRKNTANGSLTVSVGVSTTGIFEDTTHTDSVTSGDVIDLQVTVAASASGTLIVMVAAVDCVVTTGAVPFVESSTPTGASFAFGATSYLPYQGQCGAPASAEANVQGVTGLGLTAAFLEADALTNTVNGASTVTFRKNAGAATMTLSIGSSTTGHFEDTTHTDAVLATDKIDTQVVTGGTSGALALNNVAMLATLGPAGALTGAVVAGGSASGTLVPALTGGAGGQAGAAAALTVRLAGSATARAAATGACSTATITVDPTTSYQTMGGWEATSQSGEVDSPVFSTYADYLFGQAANDLGINRVRWEITTTQTGSPTAFDFTSFDDNGVKVIQPLRTKVAANGESLWLNVCYVYHSATDTNLATPSTYAAAVKATYDHCAATYGFLPDSWEVVLEPDTFSWPSPTALGNCLKAAGDALVAAGYTPYFVAPSNTNAAAAVTEFNSMVAAVPAVLSSGYLKEFSYHRYATPSSADLSSIATIGSTDSLQTGMLEHIGSGVDDLLADLTQAQVSNWQQFTLAYPTTDNGAQYYVINNAGGSAPADVSLGSRTYYLRQVFRHVRRGAVRKAATSINANLSAVAFANSNGLYTVVIRATAAVSGFTVAGIPSGTYGAFYTTGDGTSTPSAADVQLSDQVVATTATLSIPAAGVITLYQRSTSLLSASAVAQASATGAPNLSVGSNTANGKATPAATLVIGATAAAGGAAGAAAALSVSVSLAAGVVTGSGGAAAGVSLAIVGTAAPQAAVTAAPRLALSAAAATAPVVAGALAGAVALTGASAAQAVATGAPALGLAGSGTGQPAVSGTVTGGALSVSVSAHALAAAGPTLRLVGPVVVQPIVAGTLTGAALSGSVLGQAATAALLTLATSGLGGAGAGQAVVAGSVSLGVVGALATQATASAALGPALTGSSFAAAAASAIPTLALAGQTRAQGQAAALFTVNLPLGAVSTMAQATVSVTLGIVAPLAGSSATAAQATATPRLAFAGTAQGHSAAAGAVALALSATTAPTATASATLVAFVVLAGMVTGDGLAAALLGVVAPGLPGAVVAYDAPAGSVSAYDAPVRR